MSFKMFISVPFLMKVHDGYKIPPVNHISLSLKNKFCNNNDNKFKNYKALVIRKDLPIPSRGIVYL